jgi:tricorn protease-like protein
MECLPGPGSGTDDRGCLYLNDHRFGKTTSCAIGLLVVGNLRVEPDGRWLAFSVLNTDQFTPTATTGLLEL